MRVGKDVGQLLRRRGREPGRALAHPGLKRLGHNAAVYDVAPDDAALRERGGRVVRVAQQVAGIAPGLRQVPDESRVLSVVHLGKIEKGPLSGAVEVVVRPGRQLVVGQDLSLIHI
eukprot:TRINITY_DN35846_c0_g1_i1.p3 TRINITY_DN35846_c0_g1~~TRINITY_DN35846_c0_g1_i1.p3  ORF type:complete len:116 (-),score=34.13 TRINITY_DN35846_c0_g1_i1:96-443(-)